MRIHWLLSSLFLAFTSVSCVTTKTITGPDGTPHILTSCTEIEKCYQQAQENCGGTYKIINTSNEVSGTDGQTFSRTNLLIKCD